MSPRGAHPFFLTTSVANRVLVPLLSGRAGRVLGRHLAVVEYEGQRTGQTRRLVTQYSRDGSVVRIKVGLAERKTWWRNFQRPYAVRLVLAGRRHDATARVERDGDLMDVVAVLSTRGPAAPETASATEAHLAGRSRS